MVSLVISPHFLCIFEFGTLHCRGRVESRCVCDVM